MPSKGFIYIYIYIYLKKKTLKRKQNFFIYTHFHYEKRIYNFLKFHIFYSRNLKKKYYFL